MGAPVGNKFAMGNRGSGRSTLYKPTYAEIARRMCAQGASVTTTAATWWQQVFMALRVARDPTGPDNEAHLRGMF